MPIERLPIVHKFGIISHSHRLEIQERILQAQATAAATQGKHTTVKSTRPSYLLGEMSEEFVNKFNLEKDQSKLARWENQAQLIVARVRRRLSVANEGKTGAASGASASEGVAKAWIDLSLLSQCQGKVQEEALDVLVWSLGREPVGVGVLPAVMYLGEASMYWLRYKLMREPYLRSAEIKLLKVSELVFDRLLTHHMLGDLVGHKEFMDRLAAYNEGFVEECEDSYAPYPTIVQTLNKMSYISKEITRHRNEEEFSSLTIPNLFNDHKSFTEDGGLLREHLPFTWHALDVWEHLKANQKKPANAQVAITPDPINDLLLDENIFNVNESNLQFLAQIATNKMKALRAFQKLAFTRKSIPSTNNTDQVEAKDHGRDTPASGVTSISDVNSIRPNVPRKNSPDIVHVGGDEVRSMLLSEGAPSTPPSGAHHATYHGVDSDRSGLSTNRVTMSLGMIKESDSSAVSHGDKESSGTGVPGEMLTPESSNASSSRHLPLLSTGEADMGRAPSKTLVTEEDIAWDNIALVDRHLWAPFRTQSQSSHMSTREDGSEYSGPLGAVTVSPPPPDSPNLGPELKSSRSLSCTQASTSSLDSPKNVKNFHQWPWQIAVCYTRLMGQIVAGATSANIRKAALLGANSPDALFDTRRYTFQPLSNKNVGIMDLLYFEHPDCIWSWKVRFAAMESLVAIYKCLEPPSTAQQKGVTSPRSGAGAGASNTHDGVRNICWAGILDIVNRDKEMRVPEARKLGQVGASVFATPENSGITSVDAQMTQQSLISLSNHRERVLRAHEKSKKAAALKIKEEQQKKIQAGIGAKKRVDLKAGSALKTSSTASEKPARLTIKEEIQVHMELSEKPLGVGERGRAQLHRVMEDQWRKEIHQSETLGIHPSSLKSTPAPSERDD